jgi:hypothetical protein
MTDEAVLAANRAFYDAFETGDIDLMGALWDGEGCVCIHPGTAPIHGRGPVLRSLSLIMANTSYVQFFLTDVEVTGSRERAVVTCTENILTAAAPGEPEEALVGARAAAMNVFVRRPGGWRLWVHQASSVLSGPT